MGGGQGLEVHAGAARAAGLGSGGWAGESLTGEVGAIEDGSARCRDGAARGVAVGMAGRGPPSCWVLMENQLAFDPSQARSGAGGGTGRGSGVVGGGESGGGSSLQGLERASAVKSKTLVKGVYVSRAAAVGDAHLLWQAQFGEERLYARPCRVGGEM